MLKINLLQAIHYLIGTKFLNVLILTMFLQCSDTMQIGFLQELQILQCSNIVSEVPSSNYIRLWSFMMQDVTLLNQNSSTFSHNARSYLTKSKFLHVRHGARNNLTKLKFLNVLIW